MLDDQKLLHAYVNQGSSEAFTRLVERHTDLVYSAALRRVGGDSHRARDVSQRVFIDLAKKAPRLVGHPLLSGWLHQSTRWAALSERRAETRRIRAEQAAAADLPKVAPTDAWVEVRAVLDETLDALGERDRDVIVMRFFLAMPYAEMAVRAGCAENAARMRVERALERLQGALRRKGITSTAGALSGVLAQHAVAAAPPGLAGGLAGQALATASAGAVAEVAGTWLSVMAAKLPLVLVAVIASVLGWGLFDTRVDLNRDRADRAGWEARRDSSRQAVAQLERTKQRALDRQDRLPALAEMPEPTALQIERRRLDLIVRKGELDREYAGLFQRLRLPPPELDRLKELIVDRNQAIYDALQVAKAEGVTLTYAESRELERAAVAAGDLEIAALLGPNWDRAQRFLHTVNIRRNLNLLTTVEDSERAAKEDALITTFGPRLEVWMGNKQRTADYYAALPEDIEAQLRKLLTPGEVAERQRWLELEKSLSRMMALSREAAYAGKLKLSARSARDYLKPADGGSRP